MVRAGLPIEEALTRSGKISVKEHDQNKEHLKRLVDELGIGTSLANALKDDPTFPPIYGAVVEAGLRSNDLAGALDSVAHNARILRETRFFLIRMCVYPILLISFLWFVFAGTFLFTAPRYADFFDAFDTTTLTLGCMKWVAQNPYPFLAVTFIGPVLLWIGFIVWCVHSAKGTVLQTGGFRTFFGWIPWIGQATVQLQKMSFARIYAMLLRSSVPMDEAIVLAAKATNDKYWSEESREQLRRHILYSQRGLHGQNQAASIPHETKEGEDKTHFNQSEYSQTSKLPQTPLTPLIMWSLGIPKQEILIEGLEHYANISQSRAKSLILKSELLLPECLTLLCAILIGACFVLTLFWPYTDLLYKLSHI